MSAQFGRINFDGKPVDPKELDPVRPVLAPFGPDGEGYIYKDNYCGLYRAFNLVKRDSEQCQPYVSPRGLILMWDGSLDNRDDLVCEYRDSLPVAPTDVTIVAAVFEQEGTSGLSKLIGEWALSVWNPVEHSLILAKDPLGVRPLYYREQKDAVSWSSVLDPLVLFSRETSTLCEEYLAGWFSSFPAVHLTPFSNIHGVPPSSFVLWKSGTRAIAKYWDFNPAKRIMYRNDEQYEEHFRIAFANAVKHKCNSDYPIAAELSGGMDSSSIVCMADVLIADGGVGTQRLETVSHYNDFEPNWNERPYFEAVEARRGQVGCHIDVSSDETFLPELGQFTALPGANPGITPAETKFRDFIETTGARTVLSGIGGDEVTGGVPSPISDLADLLTSAQLFPFARQLKEWALIQRKPWIHLFAGLLEQFLPRRLKETGRSCQSAIWLKPDFIRRNSEALHGYRRRLRVFGAAPSFQEHLNTFEMLRRRLACNAQASRPCHYWRYPFLDRDFLEFLFAVPPQQLLRPGQRRSLMRRALRGIVPGQILDRKRKASVSRSLIVSIAAQYPQLVRSTQEMACGRAGIVDVGSFHRVLQNARLGEAFPLVPVLRTFTIETWLRGWKRFEPQRQTSIT